MSDPNVRFLHDWGQATDRVVTLHVAHHEAQYHRYAPRRAFVFWLGSCLLGAMGLAAAAIEDAVRVVP